MPSTGTSSGVPRIAPALQGEIISRRTLGHSKRKIARDLGIDRRTVDNTLQHTHQDQPKATNIGKLSEIAYSVVEQGLTDTSSKVLDRAHLGLGVLKLRQDDTERATALPPQVQIAVGLLSAPARGSVPAPTEAAAKDGGVQFQVTPPHNFSQFSLADLEAEVARRRSLLIETAVEAETCSSADGNAATTTVPQGDPLPPQEERGSAPVCAPGESNAG